VSNYLSLSLWHQPDERALIPIVLPNRTAQGRSRRCQSAHGAGALHQCDGGARQLAQGLTGVVFWADAAKTVNAGGQPT
jgi:hyaluronate lyase